MANEAAQKAMDICKYKIITKAEHVFVMSIMFNMMFEWRTKDVWTAATDGKTIFINPDRWVKLDNQYRTFVLLHETYHVVFKHCTRAKRMPHLNHEKMNAAEDYMINLIIHDEMGWHPDDCLFDEQYRDMSSMQIYNSLPEDAKPPELDVIQAGTPSSDVESSEADDMDAHIDTMIITAAVAHEKKNGPQSGVMGYGSSLGRMVEDLMNPTIDWMPIARKHMVKHSRERLSMRKPNRRYLANRIILPSRCGKAMDDVCVWCDSSGSVSEKELREYVSFVRFMHKQLKPEHIYLGSFDHELHPGGVYKRREKIPAITLEGGGGTDIQKVIDDCIEKKPALVVIFTDGYFYAQKQDKVPFDLVWIILDNPNFKSNIGRVIHHTTK
ncbi:MAG: hypothetical protein HRT86_05890 [Ilumatobacteraceae bacterium]|nr:hypothetical protein [Ilumatobacteraceae bacterium]